MQDKYAATQGFPSAIPLQDELATASFFWTVFTSLKGFCDPLSPVQLAAAEAVRRALEAQVEELLDEKRYSSAREGRLSQTPVQSAPHDDVSQLRGRCAALTAELKRLQSEW